MDAIQSALDQLAAYQLTVETLIPDGKLRRVKTGDDKGSKKSGWYVAHEFTPANGQTVITGKYGNWKISDDAQAFSFEIEFTAEDRARWKAEQENQRRAADKEKRERNKQAIKKAGDIWPNLPTDGTSPYLKNKQIYHFGARFAKNQTLVVPVYHFGKGNLDFNLVGLQFIDPDGGKKFLTGTPKSGGFYKIPGTQAGTVLCEGFATGASIATATEKTVYVCFDAGNLVTVAKQMSTPQPYIVAADNDHNKENNKGLEVAHQIKAFNPDARIVWPQFNDGDGGTDFNDLHVSQGIDAVKAVIDGPTPEAYPPNFSPATVADISDHAPPDADSLGEPPKKARKSPPKMRGVGGFEFSLESMLENYAHVYGKSPAIFDKQRRKLISPSTLQEIAEKAYKEWKTDSGRHIVDESGVVFDPSMENDPDTTVNLFGGFPLEPAEGECDLIDDLLFYLVGSDDAVYKWVKKWIAYPLQNPGAKMRTAIVMHGSEGAGKNLFLSVLEKIYGEYSTIITQNEIESQFNGWASKKLFVIGNEVVSRQEMYHKKGIIKNMITEPEWLINDKNMSLRSEANCANFVFLSNVMQPVTPDTGDRRFLIIWTPPKKFPDFYKSVVDQMKTGGIEAFYHDLMNVDLTGFSEFSEPVMTAAKDDLIDLSMRSDERFIKRWQAGELPIDYQMCRSVDLFAAYQHWARVEGEKFTVSKTEFSMRLSRHNGATVSNNINYLAGQKRKKTSFVVPDGDPFAKKPESESKEKFVGGLVELFSCQFNEWRGNNYAQTA